VLGPEIRLKKRIVGPFATKSSVGMPVKESGPFATKSSAREHYKKTGTLIEKSHAGKDIKKEPPLWRALTIMFF
jgi:hypothetical protein